MTQAIGNDGKIRPFEELSDEERQAWMEAMSEADRRYDLYKKHGKPRTIKQKLLDYEQEQRLC